VIAGPRRGVIWRRSRTTATGIKLKLAKLRLVGSKVIQPAPGTKTLARLPIRQRARQIPVLHPHDQERPDRTVGSLCFLEGLQTNAKNRRAVPTRPERRVTCALKAGVGASASSTKPRVQFCQRISACKTKNTGFAQPLL